MSADLEILKLEKTVEQLRSPNGCPWDKQQNHDSIKNYLIEEAYELIDAIDHNNWENLKEELGDVLFQIVFHCQMAKEQGLFEMKDVIAYVNEKMIRRHPHVFQDKPTDDVDEVLTRWEEIKKSEKNHQNRQSVLDGIPSSLPALHKTFKALKKAIKHKLEIIQSEKELTEKIKTIINKKTLTQEDLSQLLFICVQLSELHQTNPEELLREELQKHLKHWRIKEKNLPI